MSDRDDDDLFEQAMRRFGVHRPGERRAGARDDRAFEEAMEEASGVPPGPAREETPGEIPSPGPDLTAEDAVFHAAMRELESVEQQGHRDRPESRRRVPSKLHGSPRSLRRRIKSGDLEAERELDLHGMRRDEAFTAVRGFIAQAIREQVEVVRIVCGRGLHSRGPAAVLPQALDEWLRRDLQASIRQAVVSPGGLGGSGAVVVILRKFGAGATSG